MGQVISKVVVGSKLLRLACWMKCCTCLHSPPKTYQEFKALVLGLDGSGKSTILQSFDAHATQDLASYNPTSGFNIQQIVTDGHKVTCWEVGGAEGLRPYWKNYCDTNSLVYVVRSSGENHVNASMDVLETFLSDQAVKEALKGGVMVVWLNQIGDSSVTADDVISKLPKQVNQVFQGFVRVVDCSVHRPKSLKLAIDTLVQLRLERNDQEQLCDSRI